MNLASDPLQVLPQLIWGPRQEAASLFEELKGQANFKMEVYRAGSLLSLLLNCGGKPAEGEARGSLGAG